MPIVVSDTSPIRALSHLGCLSLLHSLFGEVLIPPAVVAELERPRSKLPSLVVQGLAFVRVQAPQDRRLVGEFLGSLELGEAEALALAIEVRADALLIDEAAGRAVARQRGLLPIGALGILVRARQRGLVGALLPLLDRLQSELGFFISPSLRSTVLNRAEDPGEQTES